MTKQSVTRFAIISMAAAGAFLLAGADVPSVSETWRIDNLKSIGGHPVTVLGHPRLIDTPAGKAVEFNGVDDALFVEDQPLAGAQTFTWEVLFRPDLAGAPEQRFFHLQERDAKTGLDTPYRMLFEIRVIGERWCVDAFVNSAGGSQVLIDREKLHSLGAWHHAAQVYDGHEYRCYVDGTLQGKAEAKLSPMGQGHSSIGVRINRVNYFKGAFYLGRMTRRALTPAEFVKVEGLK